MAARAILGRGSVMDSALRSAPQKGQRASLALTKRSHSEQVTTVAMDASVAAIRVTQQAPVYVTRDYSAGQSSRTSSNLPASKGRFGAASAWTTRSRFPCFCSSRERW